MKTSLPLFIILIVLASCETKNNDLEEEFFPTIINISQARILPLGAEVTIQGTVTVASGTFASSLPFGYALQDSTAGIYIIDSILPMEGVFKMGELIEVNGIIESTNGLLAIREVIATKKGNGSLIVPLAVKTGNVNEYTEGLIIHTSGIIDSLSNDLPYGYKVFINDGSGPLDIYINVPTGLLVDSTAWQLSDSISVVGFSGQYDTEYENDPRTENDVQVFSRN